MNNTAILLLSFGTPSSVEDLGPYVTSIRRGHAPSDAELAMLTERYTSIGQWNNQALQDMALRQGRVLQEQLQDKWEQDIPVYVSYLHVPSETSSFSMKETVARMVKDGYSRIVAIVTTPFYSSAGTGDYERKLKVITDEYPSLQVEFIQSWWLQPSFAYYWMKAIDAYITNTEDSQWQSSDSHEGIPYSTKDTHFIFSAHSVPEETAGDYKDNIERAATFIAQRSGMANYRVAFQSAPPRPGWLGPSVERAIEEVLKEGAKRIVFIPFGFVSDHVEILHDNDVACRHLVEAGNAIYGRIMMPNDNSLFIEAMAGAIMERIKK